MFNTSDIHICLFLHALQKMKHTIFKMQLYFMEYQINEGFIDQIFTSWRVNLTSFMNSWC